MRRTRGARTEGDDVSRAAGAMGSATFISRILGLVREQVFAIFFGAGFATDAFNIAFRIPNLLRDLFAEGAMSAALVPTFISAREKEGKRKSWRLAGLVFRILFLGIGILSVIGAFFSEELVSLYASAFKEIPGKFELTVLMTRILFVYFPFVVLAAAFMSVLNACGVYFLPAFASALFNATSIVTGVALSFFAPTLGMPPIVGMAVGVVLGGVVQAFCQLPRLYREGYRWPPKVSDDPVWYREPGLRRILLLMIPGTVGLAATQINILVSSILATSQEEGAVSWLNYSFRLMQFPIGVFGVSIAVGTLSSVSKDWVGSNYEQVVGTVVKSLKKVFAINLPAAMGLAFLGYPIVELIYEYGQFTDFDTRQTSMALASYATGLVFYSAVKVLVPCFYTMGNTRIPVISSVVSVSVHIVLSLLLIAPLGYVGLALSTSLTAAFNSVLLLFFFRGKMAEKGCFFPFRDLIISFFKYLGIALLMGGLCYVSWRGLVNWVPQLYMESVLVRLMSTGVLIVEGVVFIYLLSRILGLKDFLEFVETVIGKLKK